MFKKLFLIALFFIFSNQSYAFIDPSCESSLSGLMPDKSTFIMLFLSVLLFVLIRFISILVKKIFHRSKEWTVFLFLYFLYFSIGYFLFSIKESEGLLSLSRTIAHYLRSLTDESITLSDSMLMLSALYIYIVSVVSDMSIAKRVWINWKIKIFFILTFIIGHIVGYRVSYLEQCTEFTHGIDQLLGYSLAFVSISILISLRKRADTLLMIALSGTLYNLLLLVDHFASDIIKQRSFIEVNGGMYGSLDGGYFVAASLFAIYTLYFCLTLIFTRSVKKAVMEINV